MSHFPDLTLSQKVGQLLMASFSGLELNERTQKLFEIAHVGHVILYASNVDSPKQVQALCRELQQAAKKDAHIKLNIAVDQEGGRVLRLRGGEFTSFPASRSITQTGNVAFSRRCAKALAEEMRAVGITMNLAPVCDINTNKLNPVIGLRSFGEDPETVISFASESISGHHETGILTCLKHFPGHGDTHIDSHHGLPTVSKDVETLQHVELSPFKALASLSDAIMSAHVILPAFDSVNCATFSKTVLGQLRNDFKKLIISDSITMQGALEQTKGDVAEAAIRALDAGCDVICIGGADLEIDTVIEVHQGILKALEIGRISLERIEESLKRIYQAKARFPEPSIADRALSTHVGTQDHLTLVREIAERSFEIVRRSLFCSLKDKKLFIFYSSSIKMELDKTTFFENKIIEIMSDWKEEIESASSKRPQDADLSIWIVHNVFVNPKLQSVLSSLASRGTPIVLVTVGSTYDSTFFSSFTNISTIVNTYSPTRDAIQVALDRLETI